MANITNFWVQQIVVHESETKEKKENTISTKLTDSEIKMLEDFSITSGLTKSQILRQALLSYFKTKEDDEKCVMMKSPKRKKKASV
jgi:hypothetical protein